MPTTLVEPGDVATRLHDGTVVLVRPLTRADATALRVFHERPSSETLYFRYLSRVDEHDRVALAAVVGDQLVGVGWYDVVPGTTDAEPAFVVADEWQAHGIGTLLLDCLVDRGRARGVRRFLAGTLANNAATRDQSCAGTMADMASGAGPTAWPYASIL